MMITTANSYVTVTEYQEWREQRGFDEVTDAQAEQGLLLAMDYLESKKWKGKKLDPDQSLAFPRDIYSDGAPKAIIDAQMWLAHYSTTYDLFQAVDAGKVISKTEGDLSVTYSSGVRTNGLPAFPIVDDLLSDWLFKSAGAKLLRGANYYGRGHKSY